MQHCNYRNDNANNFGITHSLVLFVWKSVNGNIIYLNLDGYLRNNLKIGINSKLSCLKEDYSLTTKT